MMNYEIQYTDKFDFFLTNGVVELSPDCTRQKMIPIFITEWKLFST